MCIRDRFLALLIGGQIVTATLSSNQRVYQQTLVFNAETKDKTLTSEPFALSGRTSNVAIEMATNLNNHWLYLELALIERNTGASYAISRELGYYQGVDEGCLLYTSRCV